MSTVLYPIYVHTYHLNLRHNVEFTTGTGTSVCNSNTFTLIVATRYLKSQSARQKCHHIVVSYITLQYHNSLIVPSLLGYGTYVLIVQ